MYRCVQVAPSLDLLDFGQNFGRALVALGATVFGIGFQALHRDWLSSIA